MRKEYDFSKGNRGAVIPSAGKTKDKVKSLRPLREEMKAVARGERPAPADAGIPSFNSVDALVRSKRSK